MNVRQKWNEKKIEDNELRNICATEKNPDTHNISYPIRFIDSHVLLNEKITLVDFTHGLKLKRESNPYRKTFKNWLKPFKSFLPRNFCLLFVCFDGEILKPLLPFITARWHFYGYLLFDVTLSYIMLALTHMWSLLRILLDWQKRQESIFFLSSEQ